MSDIALILGAGLGGIGLGTIIAAGYLYSNQDREALKNTAAGIAANLTPEQLYSRSVNIRTQNIIDQSKAQDEKMQKNTNKIKKLEALYTDIQDLDELLQPINDKLEDENISVEERTQLEKERAPILSRARKIEKEIKQYDQNLRQLAKNKLSFERDEINRGLQQEPVTQEPVTQEPVTQEPATQEPATQEEDQDFRSELDETPEEDLNMSIERSDSFSSNPPTQENRDSLSSNPPAGGSKYFTLTYTPKKATKKYKSTNNALTKRNKINKRKTKRNKRKTKRN